MARRSWLIPILGLVATGCWGGALDRKDGAIALHLLDVPIETKIVEATVTAAGRMFHARVEKPWDDPLTVFTAIPAGTDTLDIALFADTTSAAIGRRMNIPLVVVEGRIATATISFSDGPDFDVSSPKDGEELHAYDPPFAVVVGLLDPSVTATIAIRANGILQTVIDAPPYFTASIDPHLAAEPLPGSIAIEVTVCNPTNNACRTRTITVLVSRRVWRARLSGAIIGLARTNDAIFAADRTGDLVRFAITATASSELVVPNAETMVASPLALGAGPLLTPDLALLSDAKGAIQAFTRAGDLHAPAWMIDLASFGRPTAAVFDRGRIVIGAGDHVLAIDPEAPSSVRTLFSLGGALGAAPLSDQKGIAAVDQSGRITAIDASDAHLFDASVTGIVLAPLVRFHGAIVAITTDGMLQRFDESTGAPLGAPLDLSANVAEAPVVIGDRLVVAASDELAWIDGTGARTNQYAVGGPITGAPVMWDSETVAVGLRSGAIVLAREDGWKKPLAVVEGAVLALLVVPTTHPFLVTGGSRGDLELLRAEGEFFR